MIRKISVAMYIHTLKYGALASKGHAVAVPQDMKIFTKLPLLPNEIQLSKNKIMWDQPCTHVHWMFKLLYMAN